MKSEVKEELSLREKMLILEMTKATGCVSKICLEYSVPRSSFYEWKKKYDADGPVSLRRRKPIPKRHPMKHYT